MEKQRYSKKRFVFSSIIVLVVLAASTCVLPAGTVKAAYPGLNGKMFFQSNRDGDNNIYSIRLDGSSTQKLTTDTGSDEVPVVSPDGTKVAFYTDRDGNREIYLMNTDGTNQQNISNNTADDYRAHWSPDGSRIAFQTDRDGNLEIYVMDADGTNQTRLTNDAGIDGFPRWSPDGTTIAFSSSRGGDTEIFSMNTDGTNQIQLTNNAVADSVPDWSPDGSYLIFMHRSGANRSVGRIDADGSDFVELTTTMLNLSNTTYYPDGSMITFNANDDIYIMPADASASPEIFISEVAQDRLPYVQPLTIIPQTIDNSVTLDATDGSATYDAPANHADAYEEIDKTSVTITTNPQKGTAEVNPTTGVITYTPNSLAAKDSKGNIFAKINGLFFATVSAQNSHQDSFTYQICSTANNSLCTQASVTVAWAAPAEELAATGLPTGLSSALGVLITSVCLILWGYTQKASIYYSRR